MLIAVTVSIDHLQLPVVFNFLDGLEGASVEVAAPVDLASVRDALSPATPEKIASPPTPIFTEEDVANATRSLAQAKGIDAATALLKEFEIEKARSLPVEKREAFIMRAKEISVSPSAA